MNDQCAKCGSSKLIPAHVGDQGQHSDGHLHTFVYTNPEAWVFKGAVRARMHVSICGECGYAELYAENPDELYQAYLKQKVASGYDDGSA